MDPRYKSPVARVDRDEDSDFRDLDRLTTALQWMLRVGAGMMILVAISAFMQADLLSRDYTQAEAEANDLREAAIGLAFSVWWITIAIIFCRWIVLAHRNLVPLGAQHLEFRPGWAVGFFFIPVLNLWKPYQAMKSLWQNSHSVVKPELQDTTWLLRTWWTLWLISSVLGQGELRASLRAETASELTNLAFITIANCIVDFPLYLIAALLVGRIWKAQRIQRDSPAAFAPAPGFADA